MDKIIKETIEEIKKDIPKFKQHGQYQMSLGSLIKALQKERVGLFVKIDEDHYPGMPHSYYGYPSDLAFEPSTEPITVAQFLVVCETAIGTSFVGPDHASDYYKDYIMQANTPVWFSGIDTASKIGIVDVVPIDGYIKLVTETIEEAIDDNK